MGESPAIAVLQTLEGSDVQAAMLYILTQPNNDYEYASGKTYLAGVSKITLAKPSLRPNIQPDKIEAGTNLFFGHNRYHPVGPKNDRKL